MLSKTHSDILEYLMLKSGLDFRGYRVSMLERRMQRRISKTQCSTIEEYLVYLKTHDTEIKELINVFTINVSSFFRDPLTFEYVGKIIYPQICEQKKLNKEQELKIWSLGCSYGEEPYTFAMLFNEIKRKDTAPLKIQITATDIDTDAIENAQIGRYKLISMEHIKYDYLQKYFQLDGSDFVLNNKVKQMVNFTFHNILDPNQDNINVTKEQYDVISCRNLLIYFEQAYQERIFNTLYQSLKPNGYLILGEAEVPTTPHHQKFIKVNNCCKIYQKIS